MNRREAISFLEGYYSDAKALIDRQDFQSLYNLVNDRMPIVVDAGKIVEADIDSLLKEQADNPFGRILESMWTYFKANTMVETVKDIFAHLMAAQQAQQQDVASAFDQIAAETLGEKKLGEKK